MTTAQAAYEAKYHHTDIKVGDRVDHIEGGYASNEFGYVSRLGTVTGIAVLPYGIEVTVAHDDCGNCTWASWALRKVLEG